MPVMFLSALLTSRLAMAQEVTPLLDLVDISDTDIRNAAFAFINTTTSPGLEGATLNVDNDERNSNQWRSSLGFNAEITLQDYIFNGYWGLAVVGGSLVDNIRLTSTTGQPIKINLRRDIITLRGSLGLSFPVNEHFKLRPVLTLAVSDMQTSTSINGDLYSDGNPSTIDIDNSAQLLSTTASIDALYWYWHDDYRMELSAHYNLIYTDSFSETEPILDTHAWSQTAQLKSQISGPTSLTMSARPWRWMAYANHINFISQDNRALGYTGLFEVGAGMEWRLNIKPLDWFGWQYVGISAGVITSRNVDGFNVGLTAR
ncbi:MAG: hypothetical protein IMF14_05470 [Proteobacteria bacterium]|nr:hypothetical protein [Pseudomonadota bacterium]